MDATKDMRTTLCLCTVTWNAKAYKYRTKNCLFSLKKPRPKAQPVVCSFRFMMRMWTWERLASIFLCLMNDSPLSFFVWWETGVCSRIAQKKKNTGNTPSALKWDQTSIRKIHQFTSMRLISSGKTSWWKAVWCSTHLSAFQTPEVTRT